MAAITLSEAENHETIPKLSLSLLGYCSRGRVNGQGAWSDIGSFTYFEAGWGVDTSEGYIVSIVTVFIICSFESGIN